MLSYCELQDAYGTPSFSSPTVKPIREGDGRGMRGVADTPEAPPAQESVGAPAAGYEREVHAPPPPTNRVLPAPRPALAFDRMDIAIAVFAIGILMVMRN